MSSLKNALTPEQRDQLRHALRNALSVDYVQQRADRLSKPGKTPFLKTRETDTLVAELLGFHNANEMFAHTLDELVVHEFIYSHRHGNDIVRVATHTEHQLTTLEAVMASHIEFEPNRDGTFEFNRSYNTDQKDAGVTSLSPNTTACVVVNMHPQRFTIETDDYVRALPHKAKEAEAFILTSLIAFIDCGVRFDYDTDNFFIAAELQGTYPVTPSNFKESRDVLRQLLMHFELSDIVQPDTPLERGLIEVDADRSVLWSPSEQFIALVDNESGAITDVAFFATHDNHPVRQKMVALLSEDLTRANMRRV